MRVMDVMQADLKTIRATEMVGEAVALLAESHITGLPVVDDHGKLLGVLSGSDILEVIAEHTDPEAREAIFDETKVHEVMTPHPQTIAPDATVKEAAQRMLYLEEHRLFVEQGGRLLGVVTTTDLVRALAGQRA